MATLTAQQIQEVRSKLAQKYSGIRETVPITKAEFTALLGLIDGQLETAESAIASAIPAGPGKTWLTTETAISRDIVAEVERKRGEVL